MAGSNSTETIYENTQDLDGDKKKKGLSCFHLLLLSLVILCVLLLLGIGVVTWITIDLHNLKGKLRDQEKEILHLREENLHLLIKKSIVEIVLEPLISEWDDLKMVLEVFMSFDNFPMNHLCPDKQCLPCQAGWLSFLERCSLYYNQGSPHKTWRGTRPYCQNTSADLVVVDDLSKQNLLSNEVIMDFCSLGRTDNNWFWIDGVNETLGFWIDDANSTGSYAVMLYVWLFNTKNWTQPTPGSWNNSICDQDALKGLL